jgi:hypothetical protein
MRITLEVSNYRCFPAHPPAVFEIGDGVTAFVGENNAGKSTAMRLLHDLRPLFQQIATPQGLSELLQRDTGIGFGTEVRDHKEVMFNGGAERLEVVVSVDDAVAPRDGLKSFPSKLKLSCVGTSWKASWPGPDRRLFLIDSFKKAYVHNAPGTIEGDAQAIMVSKYPSTSASFQNT